MPRLIVMVEDSDDDAVIICRNLKEHIEGPLAIIRHGTLGEARQFVEKNKSDITLILLDLGLPDASSREHAFRDMQPYSDDIPIVILTGADDHQLAVNLVALGAEGFINKDILSDRPEMLRDEVEFAISRHKHTAQARQQKDQVISWMSGAYSLNK